jgi:hypothetical protein
MKIKFFNIIFIFILISLISLILIVPTFLSNFIIGTVSGNIDFKYSIINYDNKILEYSFHHKKYDGDLMSLTIKKMTNLSEKINKSKFFYYNYQKVYNPNNPKYSSFTNICAFILKKILANSNKKIKVGIIVSKRHCLNNKYKSGNYFNIATYYVYPNMNFNNICEIHYSTIIKVKNNFKKVSLKINDLCNFYNCNYIFNSHRNLSYIERDDGYKLLRIQLKEEIPSEKDIDDMYHFKNKKQLIVFNNYDKKWIITKIVLHKN